MALGLSLSQVTTRLPNIQVLHAPLLMRWMADLIQPHGPGEVLRLHPIALAAYIGLWVTAMNLLPVGQLDGGHVAYSVFGSRFRYVAWATLAAMIFLGMTVWSGWYFWAAFVALVGVDHAPPLNDITTLDRKRYVAFLFAVVLFIITFVPRPF